MKASVAQLVRTSAAIYAGAGVCLATGAAFTDSAGLIKAGCVMALAGIAAWALAGLFTPPPRRRP